MHSIIFFFASVLFTGLAFTHAQMSMPGDQTGNGTATTPLCVSTPWDPSCADYKYPAELQDADNRDLCSQMDFMSGCSVNKACKASTMTTDSLTAKGYCDGFSILANTCQNDMPKMRGCKNYVSMCAPANSTVRQCRSGCEKCTYASPTAFGNCDLLAVYSQLCVAMPNMEECSSWKTMCTESPELHSLCGTEATTSPPVMKMFFHNEPTHVLFKSWVPRVAGDYTWSFFLLLIMGIMVEGIQSYRPMLERSMTLVNRGNPTIAQKYINGKAYIYYPSLFVVRGVEALLAYLLMLAAMSFNIIIFSAVISGLTIGYIVFLPMKLKLREAHACCGESDSSSLCC